MKPISNISKVSGKTTRVKNGWMIKAIARYLDEVGEATATQIKNHARSKGSKRKASGSRLTGLNAQQISGRLRIHKSFAAEKKFCTHSRKEINYWRLVNRELIE
tara:strand:- start:4577 stop:4888 length:312 start_codon:yes stop_codon:yes gene_type:complete